MTAKSKQYFARAAKVTPGGVHSVARGLPLWKPHPIYFERASGSKIYDVDGRQYIDYVMGFGSILLGHCDPRIIKAVREQIDKMTATGLSVDIEVEPAEIISRVVPCAENVLFSNTGSEAAMWAVIFARAYSKRKKILKFEGHYHGWGEELMTSYPSLRTEGGRSNNTANHPSVAEIDTSGQVIVIPWNDPDIFTSTLRRFRNEIAAVITEPYLCNSGCIGPEPGYLNLLREETQNNDTLLIFDEALTGFRVSLGGAQEYYKVYPDMAILGKAIGAGMTVSAVVGREDILRLATTGAVVHSGSHNSSAEGMAATLAFLQVLL